MSAVPESLTSLGFSRNIVDPQGTGANGVLIVGEAPGEMEDDHGIPFHPYAQSGSILERSIRRIGMNREQFVITNVVPSRPPNNWLEGAPYAAEAISWGKPYLEETIAAFKPRAILALGATATRALTGLAGPKLGISHLAGYVVASLYGPPVIPCFHPAFLRRGKMSHTSILMRCLRLAVQTSYNRIAAELPSPLDSPYILRPTPEQAEEYLFMDRVGPAARSEPWLAYDIETYYSNAEEEAEEHDAKDIRSIQFSLAPGTGIFLPWRDPYIRIARKILSLRGRKVGWNNWRFDDPALRAAGCEIAGEVHDLMWAWHHSQPDLPRGLQFAAAMQGPSITQPTHVWKYPWKHLSEAHAEFYGIVDVDVLQWLLTY